MKKILNLIMIMATLALVLPSCELDRYPTDQFDTNDAFKTMIDARGHRNGLYNNLRSCQYGIFTQTTELMGDMFNAVNGFGNQMGTPHRVEILLLEDNSVANIWAGAYGGIAQANHFLDNAHRIETRTAQEADELRTYIAEARYIRAYLYYVLIKHFGADYEPGTADEPHTGVPVVTTFDINARPGRESLGFVYRFIVSELRDIEEDLSPGAARSVRITNHAAMALRAKIHLLMHDFLNAAKTADHIIASGLYTLSTTPQALRRMWVNDDSPEDIFLLAVSKTETAPTQSIFVGLDIASSDVNRSWLGDDANLYFPYYIPTRKAVDQYTFGDWRREVYFSNPRTQLLISAGGLHSNVLFMNKFPGNPEWFTTATTNYRHMPKVARIAEVYLIAAEARAHEDNPEYQPVIALQHLNRLRVARGLPALSVWSDQELRDEWAREMLGEGVRLECLKRWGVGYDNRFPQLEAANAVAGNTSSERDQYTHRRMVANGPEWYRFALPIPLNDIQTNPNIKQTPAWLGQ
jgi:hypothetical protein